MEAQSSARQAQSSAQLENEWVELEVASPEDSLERTRAHKAKLVLDALEAGDISRVSLLARTPEGLVTSDLRVCAWQMLLGLPQSPQADRVLASTDFPTANHLLPHKDENQILLDINRLFTVMLHFTSFSHSVGSSFTAILSKNDVEAMRERLFSLIVRVLRKHPCLNYYQGYHDIASVVLVVCNDMPSGDDIAATILERLTVDHLRDFMITDIGLSVNHLKLIPCIVKSEDLLLFELVRHTSNSFIVSNGTYFDYEFIQALLSVITMFSHDIGNVSHLLMLWDFILSYRSVAASVYIYAAIMLHFKESIFQELFISNQDDLATLDPDLVHTVLSPTNLFSRITDSDLSDILLLSLRLISSRLLTTLADSDKTFNVWFGEFNKHSVLCTSSILQVESLDANSCVGTANELLESLLQTQEQEQQRETINKSTLMGNALEQDSLATSQASLDEEMSSAYLLSSSISSISGASQIIKRDIIQTSSMFKLLLPHRTDGSLGPGEKKEGVLNDLYKISLTVGLVGFFMHFLLKHLQWPNARTFHLFTGHVGAFTSNLAVFRRDIGYGVSQVVGSLYAFLDMGRPGLDFTQVGLGTLRNLGFGS